MIEVKLSDAISAHRAFTRIGEADMPPKAAYRVARLIAKLRAEEVAYTEAHVKILKANGGTAVGGGAAPPQPPQREKDETDAAFAERSKQHDAAMVKIADELTVLIGDTVRIDYDPIPLSMFEKTEPDANDKSRQVVKPNLKPNDISQVLAFIEDK